MKTLFTIVLFSFLSFNHNLYFIPTAEAITVAWDASTGAEWYELQLFEVRKDRYLAVVDRDGNDADLVCSFKLPGSGHYFMEVRACNQESCSEWVSSKDQEIEQDPNGWWLFGHPSAPTGGGIS